MEILAQSQQGDLVNAISPLLQGIGVPGALLIIIAYTFRRAFYFCKPWAEQIAQAHISRQNAMEASQTKLTDSLIEQGRKTMEMHQQNHDMLKSLVERFPTICKSVK